MFLERLNVLSGLVGELRSAGCGAWLVLVGVVLAFQLVASLLILWCGNCLLSLAGHPGIPVSVWSVLVLWGVLHLLGWFDSSKK